MPQNSILLRARQDRIQHKSRVTTPAMSASSNSVSVLNVTISWTLVLHEALQNLACSPLAGLHSA